MSSLARHCVAARHNRKIEKRDHIGGDFLMVEFLVIINSARIFFFFFFSFAIPSTFGFISVIFPILFLLFDFIVVDYGVSVLSEE